ncbi:MAG: hypothetical protein R3Y06_11115 [Faecalibacterium sp.]
MKTPTLKETFQYRFDNLMAKGTVALVCVLFLASAAVVVVMGTLLLLLNGDTTFGGNVWTGIMHLIDAGTITAADTSQPAFVVLMSLVTLCGLFVTSILIGIITTGFEERLNDLKKGNSRVIEKDHTVILGFDKNVFTLISELITANESRKDACIVILCEDEKESVETAITAEFPDTKSTRIICRTGNISDTTMLEKCAVENARSIIINEAEDFLTIKSILALNNYLKNCGASPDQPHIVTTVKEKANFEASKLIADGRAEVILVQDSIARIIAQTCRQPGLSNVLIELFDYDGDELYFETCPSLAGKTFGEALHCFEKAILFGYKRAGKVHLNPAKDTILNAEDALLLLVEDDGMAKPILHVAQDVSALIANNAVENTIENVLILGASELAQQTILELDAFFATGSTVTLASNEIAPEFAALAKEMEHINLVLAPCDITSHATLTHLLESNINHVLLLSSTDNDPETVDARTLLQLIHLRDIAEKQHKTFNITSEMQEVSNQKLAQVAKANDLVVGSNIINLILTQISENRDLANVFRELLQADGSEIYMRPAAAYLTLNTPLDFYAVTDILSKRNEIAIGYKKQNGDAFEIITNPKKSDLITFTEQDYIISLSED